MVDFNAVFAEFSSHHWGEMQNLPDFMKEILDGKAELSLLENNIVKVAVYDYVHLEEADVKNIHELKIRMVKNRRHFVLLVPGKFWSASKEAREFSAKEEVSEKRMAKAIVTSTLAHKIIGNFFLRVNQPKSLVKLFNSETEAISWLKKLSE